MPHDTAPFRVAFVPGVTVSKWTRVWQERRPAQPLQVLPTELGEQTAVLRNEVADMGFVRLPVDDERGLSIIPLWSEDPFVVVPKDHPVSAFDSVTLADLADEHHLDGPFESSIELVGANVGVVVVPQSIARLYARKDVVARPVTDAPATRIALCWLEHSTTDLIEEFIGIVRGRTALSSRGTPTPPSPPPARRSPRAASKPAPSRGKGRRPRQGR